MVTCIVLGFPLAIPPASTFSNVPKGGLENVFKPQRSHLAMGLAAARGQSLTAPRVMGIITQSTNQLKLPT